MANAIDASPDLGLSVRFFGKETQHNADGPHCKCHNLQNKNEHHVGAYYFLLLD